MYGRRSFSCRVVFLRVSFFPDTRMSRLHTITASSLFLLRFLTLYPCFYYCSHLCMYIDIYDAYYRHWYMCFGFDDALPWMPCKVSSIVIWCIRNSINSRLETDGAISEGECFYGMQTPSNSSMSLSNSCVTKTKVLFVLRISIQVTMWCAGSIYQCKQAKNRTSRGSIHASIVKSAPGTSGLVFDGSLPLAASAFGDWTSHEFVITWNDVTELGKSSLSSHTEIEGW